MPIRVSSNSYNRNSMALPFRLAALALISTAGLASAHSQTAAQTVAQTVAQTTPPNEIKVPQSVTLPAGTPLAVSTLDHLPMRAGEVLITHTLYSIYADNALALPAGTEITGSVVSLHPDHAARIDARLGGDFTPLDKPVVRFTAIRLANGIVVPITTGSASDGAPVYKVIATQPRKGGLIGDEYTALKQRAYDSLDTIIGPDKVDRTKQFFYSQLPYHPQRISKGTAWTVETDAPASFVLPPTVAKAQALPPPPPRHRGRFAKLVGRPEKPVPAPQANNDHGWILRAYLSQPMSSATSKPGESIQATVARPVFNIDGTLAVPQGSIISGTITQVRRARTFSRAPRLRFSFTTLTLPGAKPQTVRAALTGVDSNSPNQLAMNNEGVVEPKPKDRLAIPLLLFALASQPLDNEHGHDQLRKSAVASNSLGLLGFIVGVAAQQPYAAAGIGYYGSAISLYQRLIRRGPEITFARDTRILLQTTPTSNNPLKPTAH